MEYPPDIEVIGKGGGKEPFRIVGQRGLYFFIRTETFDRLREINDAYRLTGQTDPKPLDAIKVVGRRGVVGRRPFLLPGRSGTYLCILDEHLKQLVKIAQAYKMWLEAKEEEKKLERIVKPPEEGRYVYCIIPWDGSDRSLSFGEIGIENSGEVYTIPYGDVAAVVSNAPFKEYTPNKENAYAHIQVMTLVMREHTVLPMAFGMVFKNEEVLRRVLERSRDELRKALNEIEGKAEFGVKVVRPKGVELDEDAFASEIGELRKLAVQTKLGKRFSRSLILNAYYLIRKEDVENFLNKARALEEKFKQLKFQVTGPWPPSNFVKIKIGRRD
ncbi:MAG: GvpL/GvpF family gas vesicle protein [Thaumarchaeota archaeon]|nr:GvpL/GvpF family gas vesicle protein [Nitrososphaerota archaeon]